jgi:hypothetical protein
MSSKIKNILIIGGIGAVLILGYFLFFKKTPDQPALVSSTGSAVLPTNTASDQTSTISKDFLAVLLNVKGIKIDDSIFTDPAFLSLRDSSIELVSDGTEGRPNPFAPLGSDVNTVNTLIIPPTFPTDTPTFPTFPTTEITGSGN